MSTTDQTSAHESQPREMLLERAVKKFQIIGVVATIVVGLFTAFNILANLYIASQKDTREQISDSVLFYSGLADRALKIDTNGTLPSYEMFSASFKEAYSRPPPNFRRFWLDKKTVGLGYAQLCQERKYAIEAFNSKAGSLLPTLEAWKQSNSPGARAGQATDKYCVDILGAAQEAGMKALIQTAQSTSNTIVINKSEPNIGSGWAIDSLYCGGASGSNWSAASLVAKAIGKIADTGSSSGEGSFGLVRLRPGVGTNLNAVFYDPTERKLAISLAKIAQDETGQPYQVVANPGDPTPWYISIYSCGSRT